MVIAIDGPAGVGKSTIAHRIALEYGFHFLNSGNFYRTVAFIAIKKQISPENSDELKKTADSLSLTLNGDHLLWEGQNIEPFLHTHEIDEIVAPISAIPEVRTSINRLIRNLYSHANLVCEGRDMTTVVFPDAEIKIYLDASPEVRALRRVRQGVSQEDFGTVLASIRNRDHIDTKKPVGSLQVAGDALYIDTSDLDLESVLKKIICHINEKIGERDEL